MILLAETTREERAETDWRGCLSYYGIFPLFNISGGMTMWYDLNQTLTHNCLFNIVIGNRGSGKTYGAKKRAIKKFLETGAQFIYLRRYETELDDVADVLFNDIIANKEFEGHTIKYKGGMYFLNDTLMGYAMALTKAHYLKSASFPLVDLIIFDECIIDDSGTAHYLKNEVRKFLDFYETIARMRENCIVFFLSNALSIVNPYTLFWDLNMPYKGTIAKKGEVLLQLVQDQDFIDKKKETRFGKLIAGTEYADYSIENKFLLDSPEFLQKKTGKSQFYFNFKYAGELYGVWVDYGIGLYFVSRDIDPSCTLTYSITLEDHSPNQMLANTVNKTRALKAFIDGYKTGVVRFENIKIKNVVYKAIKILVGGK